MQPSSSRAWMNAEREKGRESRAAAQTRRSSLWRGAILAGFGLSQQCGANAGPASQNHSYTIKKPQHSGCGLKLNQSSFKNDLSLAKKRRLQAGRYYEVKALFSTCSQCRRLFIPVQFSRPPAPAVRPRRCCRRYRPHPPPSRCPLPASSRRGFHPPAGYPPAAPRRPRCR